MPKKYDVYFAEDFLPYLRSQQKTVKVSRIGLFERAEATCFPLCFLHIIFKEYIHFAQFNFSIIYSFVVFVWSYYKIAFCLCKVQNRDIL